MSHPATRRGGHPGHRGASGASGASGALIVSMEARRAKWGIRTSKGSCLTVDQLDLRSQQPPLESVDVQRGTSTSKYIQVHPSTSTVLRVPCRLRGEYLYLRIHPTWSGPIVASSSSGSPFVSLFRPEYLHTSIPPYLPYHPACSDRLAGSISHPPWSIRGPSIHPSAIRPSIHPSFFATTYYRCMPSLVPGCLSASTTSTAASLPE